MKGKIMEPYSDLVMDGLRGLASILSIGSSVKNLTQNRALTPEQALEVYKKNATPKQLKELDNPAVAEAAIAVTMVISAKLLSQLADEAQKCEDSYIDARGKAKTDRAKDEAKVKGKSCMCRVLTDIRDHNNGDLPSPVLQDWWDSYKCV